MHSAAAALANSAALTTVRPHTLMHATRTPARHQAKLAARTRPACLRRSRRVAAARVEAAAGLVLCKQEQAVGKFL